MTHEIVIVGAGPVGLFLANVRRADRSRLLEGARAGEGELRLIRRGKRPTHLARMLPRRMMPVVLDGGKPYFEAGLQLELEPLGAESLPQHCTPLRFRPKKP
jgi:hypothetical protein